MRASAIVAPTSNFLASGFSMLASSASLISACCREFIVDEKEGRMGLARIKFFESCNYWLNAGEQIYIMSLQPALHVSGVGRPAFSETKISNFGVFL